MWSIGVTTFLLLCGDTPFNGKNRQQLFRRISCDEPTFADDKWGGISDEGVDFVRKLLAKDPAKRLSAAQALSHRWLMDNKEVPIIALPHCSSQTPHSSKPQSQAPLDLGPSDRRPRGSSTSVAGSMASKAQSGSSGPSHRLREAKHSVGSSSSVAASVGSKIPSASAGPEVVS
jgi:serine/threonine protein kinase